MKLHILTSHPITGEPLRIENVTILKIWDDGTFDAIGDQWMQAFCNPDVIKIYNPAGEQVDPASAMPSTAASIDEVQQQLLDTQVALAAVYETLAAMMGGGLGA